MVNDHEYEIEQDYDYHLYTEISTNLIYDARFFDDFVIVRPASPAFWSAIMKMSTVDFSREFREFYGDPTQVIAALNSENDAAVILN